MKHLLLTTIAATLLMGCISPQNIWNAADEGNIEEVKIKSITEEWGEVPTYIIKVDKYSTFFANDILVHNK